MSQLTHKGRFFLYRVETNALLSEQVGSKKYVRKRMHGQGIPIKKLEIGCTAKVMRKVFVLCFDESFHHSSSLLSNPAAGKRPVLCSAGQADVCGKCRPWSF